MLRDDEFYGCKQGHFIDRAQLTSNHYERLMKKGPPRDGPPVYDPINMDQ